MYSLRQKTWGIFIKPYIEFQGDKLVQRGNLSVLAPCQNSNVCPSYTSVKDGEAWVLYKGEYLTSFSLVRKRVKEIMDDLGYSKHDILITEVTPFDHVVTPLV